MLEALLALPEHYRGYDWERGQADGYADAIEGTLNLYNREPVASAARWIDVGTRRMWAMQDSSAATPQWPGRASSGHHQRMARRRQLRADVHPVQPVEDAGAMRRTVAGRRRLRCLRHGDTLLVHLAADSAWAGRLRFDPPRHRTQMGLPLDWPRINQFPEWFTAEPDVRYAWWTPQPAPPACSGGATLA